MTQEILIVNGINTSKGGSGSHLLSTWTNSLDKHGKKYCVFNTVPIFPKFSSAYFKKIILALYFMPGTFLRVFRLPLFELFYKISPFLIWNFVSIVRMRKPAHVLFSHHAVFFLSCFWKREKTHYIIHDLLYRRARSLGFNRRISKFVFWVECHIYRRAASLLCLSFQERRILSCFGFNRLQLISSYQLDGANYPPETYDSGSVALVSDWRRHENIHGLAAFFDRPCEKHEEVAGILPVFKVYGFESASACGVLENLPEATSKLIVEDRGFYRNHSEIFEGIFLVPIYQGAGIKIKVLEAFRNRRYVLGTRGAFEGLPRRWLIDVSAVMASLNDLPQGVVEVNPDAFDEFEVRYQANFKELGCISF